MITEQCEECGRQLLYISWSKLQMWEQCKAKARLYRKHKSPGSDIRIFFPGTIVDRVMRAWLQDPNTPPGAMQEMIEKIAVEAEIEAKESGDGIVKWRNASDKRDVYAFCKELLIRLEPILNKLVLPYEYQPAYRFKTPITIPYLDGTPTQIMLVGETDILTRDEDKVFSVWDLKGTRDDTYWRKTRGQLVFYDLAVASMFGGYSKVVGLIQPMCKERVLAFRVSEEDRSVILSKITRMAADYWRKDFSPKADSTGCTRCPVYHACPKWNPVNQSAGKPLSLTEMVKQSSILGSLTDPDAV